MYGTDPVLWAVVLLPPVMGLVACIVEYWLRWRAHRDRS